MTTPAASELPPAVPPESQGGAESQSPYRNLWVPLIVVPALIGIVLVVVFVLFGAVSGKEAPPEENLSRMLDGGKNERQQASFGLVRQILERKDAIARGEPATFAITPVFSERLTSAFDSADLRDEEQYEQAYLCANVLFELGEPGGFERLVQLADASDTADPKGFVRFTLLSSFGALAERLDAAQRARANELLVRFVEHSDPGLVRAAAMSLQRYPSDASAAALRGLLGSSELDLRGQAAISLSHLGDAAGAGVLVEMLEPGAYERAHAAQSHKFAKARDVSQARVKALEALLRLGDPAHRARIEELSRTDADLGVREAAIRALSAAPSR
ncbi:MAG: hypothetical protein EPO68_04570 [Planctomycetota bacterium]|nr:MAG: hypothetical protein EPO68_04570 [Planctomycetota bacterium]